MKSAPAISEERIRLYPEQPGVYLMRDAEGEIIYIGKAKALRSRIRNYFSGTDERHSVQYLMARLATIETIVTEDERQALLLEADLIRKHKPRYNIRLKDDRAYLSVRVDFSAQWPRLELVRVENEDGATYLGPFTFSYELRTMLELIKRTVPLRTCSDTVMNNRVRPCIEYQIKRCAGPCCLAVDKAEYNRWIEQAIQMLQGKNKEVQYELEHQMQRASEELRFEDAAAIRDRLEVLRRFQTDNSSVNFGSSAQDAFGIYREGSRVEISVLSARRGRLGAAKSFGFDQAASTDEEILGSVMSQFYSGAVEVPEDILLPLDTGDLEVRGELLGEKRGSKLNISLPQIGSKARLLSLAMSNARENFAARFSDMELGSLVARSLMEELGLEEVPRVIECVDVSHFQGSSTVASVVAFKDGKPEKSRYRHFILSQEGKPDDFASMREVIMRHLSRAAEENTLCDLLVVDGGEAQLNQAVKVRKELGLLRPEMVGLAKKRSERIGIAHQALVKIRSKKPERIFRVGEKKPLYLAPESEALHLLERLRDEAHRFAITFHRSRRKRKTFASSLDGIQGLGPKRRKELLKAFGSIKQISASTPEALVGRCGLPLKVANQVIAKLRKK